MWIVNNVPTDEEGNPIVYLEDRHALFKDEYRATWDDVKCEFPGYREYCCCSNTVLQCEANCRTGACEIKKSTFVGGTLGGEVIITP
jgi:hypothetical protein